MPNPFLPDYVPLQRTDTPPPIVSIPRGGGGQWVPLTPTGAPPPVVSIPPNAGVAPQPITPIDTNPPATIHTVPAPDAHPAQPSYAPQATYATQPYGLPQQVPYSQPQQTPYAPPRQGMNMGIRGLSIFDNPFLTGLHRLLQLHLLNQRFQY